MYFAGYPQFNQSMPQMSMPVNATNQQGSSVQGANTGMFGMGLGGFGGGFSPSGFSMPQMGYGGFGGGYGGFGGGFGMPQMGYGGFGGMGGYGGGFGMPQMGFGLGSFGSQVGFGGYGNYGGFNPQQGPTDYRPDYKAQPAVQAPSGSIQDNMNNPAYRQQMAFVNGNSEEAIRNRIQGQLNDQFTRDKNAGMSLMDMAKAQDELSNRLYSQYGIQRPGYTYGVTPPRTQPVANPSTGGYGRGQYNAMLDGPNGGYDLNGRRMGTFGDTTNQFTPDWARKYANEGKNPWSGYYSPGDAEIMKRASDAGWNAPVRAAVGDMRWTKNADLEAAKQFLNKQTGANPSTGVMPSEPIPDPGDSGMAYTQALIPATRNGVSGYYTDGSQRHFVPYDKSQSGGAYIPDETGQYDPNRGSFSSGPIPPMYSEPSTPGTEPLSVANPERNQEIIGTPIPANSAPINQPRRMRNSMNMGIGSFYGGIGPGNFRNFYTP